MRNILRFISILSIIFSSFVLGQDKNQYAQCRLADIHTSSKEKLLTIKNMTKKKKDFFDVGYDINNQQQDCSFVNLMTPQCFRKRTKSEIDVAFIYYGHEMSLADLKRIAPILKERFYLATDQEIRLNIKAMKVIDYQQKLPSDFRIDNITDRDRLLRIWYSEERKGKVLREIFEAYNLVESNETLSEVDFIIGMTGAQFESLALTTGRISIVENPSEVAWALSDGGRVEFDTDYEIVDKLIHEMGHNMSLGHSAHQCSGGVVRERMGVSITTSAVIDQMKKCCESSPSKDDVMSYCRSRKRVSPTIMNKFEECNLGAIKKYFLPALLNGESPDWRVYPKCK